MKSTSNADAALLAPKAPAKSGMVKTSVSSPTTIGLFAQKVKNGFPSTLAPPGGSW
jgi:hypothetical protein